MCRERAYIEWGLLRVAILGLMALLFGHAYIVGINQIYDVQIDKVRMCIGVSRVIVWLHVCAAPCVRAHAWKLLSLFCTCARMSEGIHTHARARTHTHAYAATQSQTTKCKRRMYRV